MIHRTVIIALSGFTLLAVLTVGCVSRSQAPSTEPGIPGDGTSPRPNIMLIISDDIGLDATTGMYPGMIDDLVKKYGPSGHNHPDYKKIDDKPASTPVLDKLSKQGMRFTHVWAHPFCSPTRATLLTGLYAAKTRVATYADALSPKHTSFVRMLKDDGGYSTAVFGKWHIAGLGGRNPYPGMKPKQAGFDIFKGNRIFPEEFESFYRTDELKSHAMERVFANIVRDKGFLLDFV